MNCVALMRFRKQLFNHQRSKLKIKEEPKPNLCSIDTREYSEKLRTLAEGNVFLVEDIRTHV